MAAAAETSTQCWVAHDNHAIKDGLVWEDLALRSAEDTDVDIEVTHCGICGTDTHTITNAYGWTTYPYCAGHEIIGTVSRVGSKVSAFKPGDRVGVGPQGYACLADDCPACGRGFPQRCAKFVQTGGIWLDGKSRNPGGMAKIHRAHQNIVMKIPDGLPSEYAAPMLCAGITSWSPLKRHGAGPGKRVGILGIGGIGHFALIWAKALGCEKVVAIGRSNSKRSDALNELGADEYIAMAEEDDWATKHASSLDLILSTSDSADIPFKELLGLLRLNGAFVMVGAPNATLPVDVLPLVAGMLRVEGSFWGTYKEVEEMFDFAVSNGVRPVIQQYSMSDANRAVGDLSDGKARYKIVLAH